MTSPLPLVSQPSDKPQWRSVAYYNCRICKRIGADYVINVPEEGGGTPIPVYSGCYMTASNRKSSGD
jgi:hypothetical protein